MCGLHNSYHLSWNINLHFRHPCHLHWFPASCFPHEIAIAFFLASYSFSHSCRGHSSLVWQHTAPLNETFQCFSLSSTQMSASLLNCPNCCGSACLMNFHLCSLSQFHLSVWPESILQDWHFCFRAFHVGLNPSRVTLHSYLSDCSLLISSEFFCFMIQSSLPFLLYPPS